MVQTLAGGLQEGCAFPPARQEKGAALGILTLSHGGLAARPEILASRCRKSGKMALPSKTHNAHFPEATPWRQVL
jgi:hypothetical protein